MIHLPPYRYIKDRSVSDYTYSDHAQGYDDALDDVRLVLLQARIQHEPIRDCTKDDLRESGHLDHDD